MERWFLPLTLVMLHLALMGQDECGGADEDGDGWTVEEGDCDDGDPEVYPGAPERCNGVDEDCDGEVDEGLHTTWYQDGDGDGYGWSDDSTEDGSLEACEAPAGYVASAGDCDDTKPEIHPDAPEGCNGMDDDCDSEVDEGVLATWYRDGDGDGFGRSEDSAETSALEACEAPDGYVASVGDCVDEDATIYPGAPDAAGDGVDSDCGGGDRPQPSVGLEASTWTSIQDALDAAVDGETVWVGAGTYLEHDLTFRGKEVTLASSGGSEATVVDAQALSRVMEFTNGEGAGTVVRGFTLTGGYAEDGGGVYLDGSSPTFNACVIRDNTATDGGGMYVYNYSIPTVTNSSISGNVASSYGGGMYVYYFSTPIVNNSTLNGNSAYTGGGMYVSSSSPPVTNSTLSGNNAAYGGGMYLIYSRPPLRNCTVTGNVASKDGGGMYLSSAVPTLANITLSGNVASREGAGMYLLESSPTVTNSTLRGNKASGNGGGMYLYDSSPPVTNSDLTGNGASNGGGMYLYESSPSVTNTTMNGNMASVNGGGIYSVSSSPTVTNTTLSGNVASGLGGGLYLHNSSPTLTSSILAFNVGMDVYAADGTLAITYSALYNMGVSHNLGHLDATNL